MIYNQITKIAGHFLFGMKSNFHEQLWEKVISSSHCDQCNFIYNTPSGWLV